MPMQVQLVSPEQVLYQGEADMVVARTTGGGDIAFLPGHAAFLGALAIWPVRIVQSGGDVLQAAVHGGFVEVSNNSVTVLTDVAELPDQIDIGRATDALARAQQALAANPDDVEAAAALARAEVRLQVTGQVNA
ncbi:MAG: F-type H+-transporting ATPase subunit epsilon [Actinomycetota bacterium]|nr:F-type H+-transporting ATPase subunit epsilon [Actinomycetota bacterium]